MDRSFSTIDSPEKPKSI